MFDVHRHISSDGFCDQNALYATSRVSEWDQVAAGEAVLSIGALGSEKLPNVDLVYDRLKQHPKLQIGEVGLDRRFDDFDDQRAFLEDMLMMGFALDRSVSVHCVWADGELLQVLKDHKGHLPVVLWHGCTASRESRMKAARMGVILSYGPRIYESKIAKEGAGLIATPWALESDWEGPEADYLPFLEQHVASFGRLVGLDVAQVVEHNDGLRTILTDQQTPWG
ncbi:MAG: TatD family hydrolase [Sphaerochaeta sp.]|jgi:TatD DNase family protein|nr:TatD family hydrolase [Sphaerochaeta sp.]